MANPTMFYAVSMNKPLPTNDDEESPTFSALELHRKIITKVRIRLLVTFWLAINSHSSIFSLSLFLSISFYFFLSLFLSLSLSLSFCLSFFLSISIRTLLLYLLSLSLFLSLGLSKTQNFTFRLKFNVTFRGIHLSRKCKIGFWVVQRKVIFQDNLVQFTCLASVHHIGNFSIVRYVKDVFKPQHFDMFLLVCQSSHKNIA